MNRFLAALGLASRVLAGLLITLSSAHALTLTVSNTNDSGPGSLRNAIIVANVLPGLDVINFMIPGAGEHVILLFSELPAITDPVQIDGYTQPGSSRNTLADGYNAMVNIVLEGAIILPPPGFQTYGLTFRDGSDGSRVSGLKIQRFSLGLVLANVGNIRVDGNKILDNALNQVLVSGANNVIGWGVPGARNLIGGMPDAVTVVGDGNSIKNNYIGFADIRGNEGVKVDAGPSGITVYFGMIGVMYHSSVIAGTDLVCDPSGLCGKGFQSNHHQIGGLERGEGNVIVGQTLAGILSLGTSKGNRGNASMRIDGNRLGANFDGSRPPGFANNFGVFLHHGDASMITVQQNTITDGVAGIVVQGKPSISGARLTQNRIVGQSLQAIDLGNDKRDTNDKLDPDFGDNGKQNFPVITGLLGSGGGNLASTPLSSFILEFFQSGICKNPETDTYLGSISVTTDASGNAPINAPISNFPGGFLTATATDKGGNTSEVSDCFQVPVAKLATKTRISMYQSPLRFGEWSSAYTVDVVGSGGASTPGGSVQLLKADANGAWVWFATAPLSGNQAFLNNLPSGTTPGTYRVKAKYMGDATFDPSESYEVVVVVYDVKHTFESATSDVLRAGFQGNAPQPGTYEILRGSDLANGNTTTWTNIGLPASKRIVASGKYVYGWGPSIFLVSDSIGIMTLAHFESGALVEGPVTGWLGGTVVETGRFFHGDQHGIVVATSLKRFEARLLYDDFDLGKFAVTQTALLRDATNEPGVNTISIAAIGDFDGDGNDDIIWDVNNGTLEMWLMDGAVMKSRAAIAPPITTVNGFAIPFAIAAVGDFDLDGRFDIVWRGGNYYYVAVMNGATPKVQPAAPILITSDWKIEVAADYDGDGITDLLWRNTLSGANALYLMVGPSQPPGNRIIPVAAFPLGSDFIDP